MNRLFKMCALIRSDNLYLEMLSRFDANLKLFPETKTKNNFEFDTRSNKTCKCYSEPMRKGARRVRFT